MPGRWSTAKIGRRSIDRLYTAPEGLVDPAAGERVLRCRVCGMPALPDSALITGTWSVGTYRMTLTLCEREIPALDPRAADPLEAFA
jgi:hypothetical protein